MTLRKISFFLFFLLSAGLVASPAVAQKHADYDLRGKNDYHWRAELNSAAPPAGVIFPAIYYLSLGDLGGLSFEQTTDSEQYSDIPPAQRKNLRAKMNPKDLAQLNLPMYIGYLAVNKYNYEFVSRVDNPAVQLMLEGMPILNPRSHQRSICSEQPYICAPNNTWNAAWVVLNEFYSRGIYVSAYSYGPEAAELAKNFAPKYAGLNQEHLWPEFSNPLPQMRSFKQQGYGHYLLADWWGRAGEEIKLERDDGFYHGDFPQYYYIALTAKGVEGLNLTQTAKEKMQVPMYAGELVVDENYNLSFNNKSAYPLSLTALVKAENALVLGERSIVDGLFDSKISAPSRTWNGLGVFLAKIQMSGDYTIFGFNSQEKETKDFEVKFLNPRPWSQKDALDPLASAFQIFRLESYIDMQTFDGKAFYELDWPERWSDLKNSAYYEMRSSLDAY